MTLSGSYIFTLSLLKNLLQESMMLKENLESSCGIPAIIGPYVLSFSWSWHNGIASNFRFFGTMNFRLGGNFTRKSFVHSLGFFTLGGKYGYNNVSKSGLHHIPRHSPTSQSDPSPSSLTESLRDNLRFNPLISDSPGLKRPPGSLKKEFFTCNSNKWGCLNNSTRITATTQVLDPYLE